MLPGPFRRFISKPVGFQVFSLYFINRSISSLTFKPPKVHRITPTKAFGRRTLTNATAGTKIPVADVYHTAKPENILAMNQSLLNKQSLSSGIPKLKDVPRTEQLFASSGAKEPIKPPRSVGTSSHQDHKDSLAAKQRRGEWSRMHLSTFSIVGILVTCVFVAYASKQAMGRGESVRTYNDDRYGKDK